MMLLATAVLSVGVVLVAASSSPLTSSFGGMFSYYDAPCSAETHYVNNFTGSYSCPAGYLPGPNLESLLPNGGCAVYPSKGCGFSALYNYCGMNFWFCYNAAAPNPEFGGMYQIQSCNKSCLNPQWCSTRPNIGNIAIRPPHRGLFDDALGCPQGYVPYVAGLFQNGGTECPATTFACLKRFQPGVSTIGGFFQEGAFPNPNTGDYSCWQGYTAIPFVTATNYGAGNPLATAYYCLIDGV
jgi:hypothetical protein